MLILKLLGLGNLIVKFKREHINLICSLFKCGNYDIIGDSNIVNSFLSAFSLAKTPKGKVTIGSQ